MAALCVPFFHHLLRPIRKTKYTKRCSVKSSTFYIRSSIYSCTFCFENGQNFERLNFDRAKMIYFFGTRWIPFFLIASFHKLLCVNCRAFYTASFDIFCFLIGRSNENITWKAQPFIMSNSLLSTAFRMSLFFIFFSNISKTVLGSSHIWFCKEFQALSFGKKRFFNHRDNRREILKILRGQFFMGRPLLKTVSYRAAVVRNNRKF
jgi:hypothetical protein